MELTWVNLFLSALPLVMAIGGAFLNDYINNKIQDVRIANIEERVEHINSNWKQRDVALFKELKELKEEIKQLSIQIAEINAKK